MSLAVEQVVPCPRCGRSVWWNPAPTQREDEDMLGPYSAVPEWLAGRARLSPPDEAGQTWLLIPQQVEGKPSFWPAELSCIMCRADANRAVSAWNTFLGRT